ncbi:MAG TPA: N-6 DNA methylase [Pyrinomonadaceae bacterium]|nr:N-6 DNA methylase [Pyrinomonadaceae bacterium]
MSVSTIVKAVQDIMRKDAGVDGDAQRINQLVWMFFLKIFDDRESEKELLEDGYRSPIPEELRWRNWAANPEGITGETLADFINANLFKSLKSLTSPDPRAQLVRHVFEEANNYMKSGTLMRQVINKINEIDFNRRNDLHLFGDIYEQILRDLQAAGNAGEFYTPRAVTQFMVEMVDPKLGERVLDPACGTGGFLTNTIEYVRKKYVHSVEEEQILQSSIKGVEKKQLPYFLCVTNLMLHGIETPNQVSHDNTLARPYRDYLPEDRVDVIVTNPPFGGMEEDGIEKNFPKSYSTRETADLFLVLIIHLLREEGRAAIVLPDGTLFGEGIKTRIKEKLLTECNLHTIVRLPNGVFSPYTGIKTNLLFFTKGQPTKEVWYYEHPYPPGAKSYNKTKPIRIEEFEAEKAWWTNRVESESCWRVTFEEIAENNFNLDVKNPHAPDEDHGDFDELLAVHNQVLLDLAETRDKLKDELMRTLQTTFEGQDELNLQTFFDNFAFLTDAPNGVGKLRQLILRLAIQGHLVSQDISDEPASKLIARILEERRNTAERNGMKMPSPLPPIPLDEMPFNLPKGWAWERLGNLGDTNIGLTYSPKDIDKDGVPVLRSGNIQKGKLDLSNLVRVALDPKPSVLVTVGDLLICARNGSRALVGKAAIIDRLLERTAFGAFMAVFRSRLNPYLYYFIASPLFRQMIDEVGTTTINQITQANLRSTIAPVPPFAEQERIVAKIEKLMALCDELEAKLRKAESDSERLMSAAVQHVLSLTTSLRSLPSVGDSVTDDGP